MVQVDMNSNFFTDLKQIKRYLNQSWLSGTAAQIIVEEALKWLDNTEAEGYYLANTKSNGLKIEATVIKLLINDFEDRAKLSRILLTAGYTVKHEVVPNEFNSDNYFVIVTKEK
jgi:DNA-binding ferritin-like protein (Dps family)